jgi:YhcH/YjgK/YiaL family protein
MIQANLQDSARYECLHPLFKQVFDYIKANDLSKVPASRIELDGSKLFINVVDTQLIPAASVKLEAHRKYIDIHVPLTQAELIACEHISGVGESEAPFDEENDFALYTYSQPTWSLVKPGEFLIVYPEDTHAPLVGNGLQRKLIVKVLMPEFL